MLADLDATAYADLVRRGDASPRELVDAAIARIERDNAELGPVIVPLYDRARATADAAPHGPFRRRADPRRATSSRTSRARRTPRA